MKQEDETVKMLKAAIDLAIENNIILFCSAEDKGENSTTGLTYPKCINTYRVISIGAATATGGAWEWSGHGEVDFLLPGHELRIPGFEDQVANHEKGHSGSSLATALAAGLAALILHCAELCSHEKCEELIDIDKMLQAFRQFNVDLKEKSLFIRIWTVFEESLKGRRPTGDDGKIIEHVMSALAC